MAEENQTHFPAVIRKTPGVIGGDACIGNRRIAVWMLVEAKKLGVSDEQLLNDYEQPLTQAERVVWEDVSGQVNGVRQLLKNLYTGISGFQDNLADGKPNDWRCRAGGRYFYVCEEGLVHLCSQQRGYPGVPLEDYTLEDVRREFYTEKPCAKFCTIACVQQVALLDNWRSPQQRQYNPDTDRKTKVEGGIVEGPVVLES